MRCSVSSSPTFTLVLLSEVPNMRIRSLVTFAVVLGLSSVVFAGLNSRKALYIGGTASIKDSTEGMLLTQDETALTFAPEKGSPLTIPYAAITGLEYGQKAGRRVGVAIMVSPLALFSKKRRHYLTVTFTDGAGKEQAAVFELGKDIVRTTLSIVEVRSGKSIEYQDEDARKASRG